MKVSTALTGSSHHHCTFKSPPTAAGAAAAAAAEGVIVFLHTDDVLKVSLSDSGAIAQDNVATQILSRPVCSTHTQKQASEVVVLIHG